MGGLRGLLLWREHSPPHSRDCYFRAHSEKDGVVNTKLQMLRKPFRDLSHIAASQTSLRKSPNCKEDLCGRYRLLLLAQIIVTIIDSMQDDVRGSVLI